MDPLFTALLGFGGYGVMGIIIIRLALECRAQLLARIADRDAQLARTDASKEDYRKTTIEVTQALQQKATSDEILARAVDRNTEAYRGERRTRSDDRIAAQKGG